MNYLVLIGLLLLNFGISWWNAYAAGRFWTETKIIGGWQRFVTWCAVIMSACGFTWCYLIIIAIVAMSFGILTPHWVEVMLKLGYLIIILPILGSGMGIWLHSLVEAYRNRTFGNIAVAGWNTFAQVHNMWDAAQNAPSAWDDVIDAFSGDGEDRAKGMVILLAILALVAGALTTAGIVRWADKKVAIDVVGART